VCICEEEGKQESGERDPTTRIRQLRLLAARCNAITKKVPLRSFFIFPFLDLVNALVFWALLFVIYYPAGRPSLIGILLKLARLDWTVPSRWRIFKKIREGPWAHGGFYEIRS
jgi:hypothetical protein